MELTTKLVKLCRKNDIEGVVKCLKRNVDINKVDKCGHSPLQVAVCRPECYDIAKLLIDAGADVNFQIPLAYASGVHDNVLMINLLHEAGADINLMADGYSPLIAATVNNCFENAICLINLGANVNLADEYGVTALMVICRVMSLEMAKFLIEHGADVNIQDNNGYTALDYAKKNGNQELIDLLLEYNAK